MTDCLGSPVISLTRWHGNLRYACMEKRKVEKNKGKNDFCFLVFVKVLLEPFLRNKKTNFWFHLLDRDFLNNCVKFYKRPNIFSTMFSLCCPTEFFLATFFVVVQVSNIKNMFAFAKIRFLKCDSKIFLFLVFLNEKF